MFRNGRAQSLFLNLLALLPDEPLPVRPAAIARSPTAILPRPVQVPHDLAAGRRICTAPDRLAGHPEMLQKHETLSTGGRKATYTHIASSGPPAATARFARLLEETHQIQDEPDGRTKWPAWCRKIIDFLPSIPGAQPETASTLPMLGR